MTASEKLIAFIRNTFDTALYFAVMAVKENFRNYIRRAGPDGRPVARDGHSRQRRLRWPKTCRD